MRPALVRMTGVLACVLLGGCSGQGAPPGSSSSSDSPSGSSSSSSPSSAVPDGVTVVDLESGPVGVADVRGTAWVALPDAGGVQPLDGDPVEVGHLPLRLVDTPDGLWVSVIGDGALVRVDPGSGKVTEEVRLRPRGSEPEGLAYDGTWLWVVDQAGDRLLQVDPASGRIRTTYPTGHEPRLASAGDTGVFVGDFTGGSVTRVVDRGVVTRDAKGCLTPQGLAEAGGVVWVACTIDGAVLGLDADTVSKQLLLPDLPGADAVVADGSLVYVVGQTGPTVWTIDAGSQEVVGELVLDDAGPTGENVAAALVGDELVVTHPEVSRAYRVPLDLLAG